jgi:hypothetical protein
MEPSSCDQEPRYRLPSRLFEVPVQRAAQSGGSDNRKLQPKAAQGILKAELFRPQQMPLRLLVGRLFVDVVFCEVAVSDACACRSRKRS